MNLKKFIKPIIFISIFYYFTSLYFDSIPRQPFDWDEYNFLKKSYYYDLFINRNFDDPRWYKGEDFAQPKVGPYIYGLSLKLAGYKDLGQTLDDIKFNEFIINEDLWYRSFAWKIVQNYPPEFEPIYKILQVGRTASTIFFLATLLIVFFTSYFIKGYLFGLMSMLLVGFSNLFLLMGRMATTDTMLLFFLHANLLLVVIYSKVTNFNLKNPQLYFIPVVIGILTALALGVKIVGIVALIFNLVSFLFLDYKKSNPYVRKSLAIHLIICLFSMLITFYFLHPFLYRNTLANFQFMFHGRVAGSYLDQLTFPTSAITSFNERLYLIVNKLFYPLNGKVSAFPLLILINILFFVFGLYKMFKVRKSYGELIILIWTAVLFITLLFYLQNDWLRYYMPLTVAIGIVQAYGILSFINITKVYLRTSQKLKL